MQFGIVFKLFFNIVSANFLTKKSPYFWVMYRAILFRQFPALSEMEERGILENTFRTPSYAPVADQWLGETRNEMNPKCAFIGM